MLESLSPEQHAAFLLREVFDYPYDRMPEIVGKSEDNVRQLTARARRHVEERRPRYEPSAELRDELARRSIAAARNGEVERLESPLSAAPPERVDTGPLRHPGAHARRPTLPSRQATGPRLRRSSAQPHAESPTPLSNGGSGRALWGLSPMVGDAAPEHDGRHEHGRSSPQLRV
jgi:Sigma-70, region 4